MQAAAPPPTVAGYVGPGFHHWPSGHIPRDADGKEAVRIRSPAKISFGEAFGEATYAAFLQNADTFFRVDSQGLHPGLVCEAPSAPLTDGVGSVLDREVDELPDEGLALILRNTPRAMPGLSHGAPLGLRSLPAG
jgi:hypothetical protein